MSITGSKAVRSGDKLGWSLRRPPVGHSSGLDRASQNYLKHSCPGVGQSPYPELSTTHERVAAATANCLTRLSIAYIKVLTSRYLKYLTLVDARAPRVIQARIEALPPTSLLMPRKRKRKKAIYLSVDELLENIIKTTNGPSGQTGIVRYTRYELNIPITAK